MYTLTYIEAYGYQRHKRGAREERLNLRLTRDESKMLEKLSGADGMAASELIRPLLRGAFAKRFPGTASPFETPQERFARQIFDLRRPGKGKR